jgi:hypothetical protein
VTSRVNYVVHRHSTLAERLGLNLRYLRCGDLSDKLRRLAGCKIAREGRGSHEMWETPLATGFRFLGIPVSFIGDFSLALSSRQASRCQSPSSFKREGAARACSGPVCTGLIDGQVTFRVHGCLGPPSCRADGPLMRRSLAPIAGVISPELV